MARRLRVDIGDVVYHVLNRRVGRMTLFEKEEDYAAFERVLSEAYERSPMRLLAYCLMPNHWHLVLWPRHDGELSRYMQWVTTTHMRRWHGHHGTRGTGALYQGRYKSFPVQEDGHFLAVCRYVERNALRAGLVKRAEQWAWSSLWRRQSGGCDWLSTLSAWPVQTPRNWLGQVNRPETAAELEALRRSSVRGAPFGQDAWVRQTANRLKLESSLQQPWRPRKQEDRGANK